MKVLLVNGSPHKNGSTNRALQEVEKTLQAAGVETEIFWIGNEPIGGCIGCGGCRKTGACVFGGVVAEFTEKAKAADGFVFDVFQQKRCKRCQKTAGEGLFIYFVDNGGLRQVVFGKKLFF